MLTDCCRNCARTLLAARATPSSREVNEHHVHVRDLELWRKSETRVREVRMLRKLRGEKADLRERLLQLCHGASVV